VPFQQIGEQRPAILHLLDSMDPGDMPDLEPSLQKAYDALTDPAHKLYTKHIIFISDGDHWSAPLPLLDKIRKKEITCSTVCITSHGAPERTKMKQIADRTKGRFHDVRDPRKLPEIYIKETRMVNKSFVYNETFAPELRFRAGPTEGLPKALRPLHGFVRTVLRPSALVEAPILTPKIDGEVFPVLAYWHYGLGKAVAFTSDALTLEKDKVRHWDREWARSEMHGKFWEQVVSWSLRAVETGKYLQMRTEERDGKVRVIVEAHDNDPEKSPLVDVSLRGGITAPVEGPGAGRPPELKFEQKNSGVYQAEFKAEDAGSYLINVTARWHKDGKEISDSVRTGVTIPYSPEFAEMESNPALLERLRELTGGETFADDELTALSRSGVIFRPQPAGNVIPQPIWPWLLALAGVGLFFDVAVRRITLEPAQVVQAARALWARLRGEAVLERAPQFLDRLQSRKAQVEAAREREQAGRRFEGGPVPAAPPPETAAPEPQPPAAPSTAEPAKEEPGNFASRLLRAKKRVWKDRDKEQ
jgi:hypothetical protein